MTKASWYTLELSVLDYLVCSECGYISFQVMKNEYGIDTSAHRSKLLSAEDVAEAHMIIPVKRELGMYISHLYPSAKDKLMFFSRDVMDPWRQPYPVYQSCARMIEMLVTEVATALSKENP
jgi:protein-tyrosine-phosphatase